MLLNMLYCRGEEKYLYFKKRNYAAWLIGIYNSTIKIDNYNVEHILYKRINYNMVMIELCLKIDPFLPPYKYVINKKVFQDYVKNLSNRELIEKICKKIGLSQYFNDHMIDMD
eukprot:gene12102-5594_t